MEALPGQQRHPARAVTENRAEQRRPGPADAGAHGGRPEQDHHGSPRTLDAASLHAALRDGAELALIDVRGQGAHSQGHPLLASCLPLSWLDLRVHDLVPRPSTRIVVLDGGAADDGLAVRAARMLSDLGYTDVRVLEDGVDGWRAAGLEVFTGVNVPSKVFGEMIEHWHDTPRVTADELAAMRARGDDMVILDSRPPDEFRRMSIPGGIDCPGAELVFRVQGMAPDPATTVVVNCAGRTRSIIGAQSLINAGIPNRVVALENGTMGWQLAGYAPATGHTEHAPPPDADALAVAVDRAAKIAERYGIERIDADGLAAWQADASRTTALLDVRTAEEFLEGHWPGARHAPGGQLVQATDEYVMVRHARLVLADSADGVRATLTAHWLRQLGWRDVRVLAGLPDSPARALPPGPAWPSGVGRIDPAALRDALAGPGAPCLIDLSSSRRFRRGHVPGAWWAVRARLSACRERLAAHGVAVDGPAVFMAPDDGLAARAAAEWMGLGGGQARVLAGGPGAWRAAGGPVAGDEPGRMLTEADDLWLKPYERVGHGPAAMQEYLSWEVGLVDQLARDGTLEFWRPPAQG